jgi:hypothetical protein
VDASELSLAKKNISVHCLTGRSGVVESTVPGMLDIAIILLRNLKMIQYGTALKLSVVND